MSMVYDIEVLRVNIDGALAAARRIYDTTEAADSPQPLQELAEDAVGALAYLQRALCKLGNVENEKEGV